MTVLVNIRRALMGHLRGLSLGVPILKENDGKEPPESGVWIQPYFLPDVTESLGKQTTDSDFRDGTFQISIYTKIGQGTREVLELADQLNLGFYHGLEVAYDGQVVQIDKVELKPGFRTGPYWHQPVSIDYQTITSRT